MHHNGLRYLMVRRVRSVKENHKYEHKANFDKYKHKATLTTGELSFISYKSSDMNYLSKPASLLVFVFREHFSMKNNFNEYDISM